MAGNVWEWCSELYSYISYVEIKPQKGWIEKALKILWSLSALSWAKVMQGRSFLCNESYCSVYRVTSRKKSSPDKGLQHNGFRLVKDWFFFKFKKNDTVSFFYLHSYQIKF